MRIKIGKAPDNDIVVDDAHVSRHHAQLSRNEEGGWVLEDLDSTNGTFVNGDQIVRKPVVATDDIQLGDRYHLNLAEALRQANDYSDEFDALKGVYDNYIKEKVQIQANNQFKIRLLQSLPFAIPGVIGILIGFMGKGSPTLFAVSLLIAICAPTVGVFLGARQSAKIPQQLQELTNRFKTEYVCPKCGTFLGEIPWESLRKRKRCPVSSCQARWTRD